MITERILKILDFKNVTKYKFCKDLGVSNAFLDKPREITTDKYANILDYFSDVNPEWLLTGKGEMLRNPNAQKTLVPASNASIEHFDLQHKYKNSSQINKKLIPFYDINAEAGTIQVSNMDSVAEPDEWIDAGDWFLDADSAMRVHGDSMFPVYKSGSIVVMREVFDKQLIIYGQDYMIQTSEYRVIKRLQKSCMKGYWLACSINSETWEKGELAGRLIHEPFDISIDNVSKICRILGCVTRNEGSKIVYTIKK